MSHGHGKIQVNTPLKLKRQLQNNGKTLIQCHRNHRYIITISINIINITWKNIIVPLITVTILIFLIKILITVIMLPAVSLSLSSSS